MKTPTLRTLCVVALLLPATFMLLEAQSPRVVVFEELSNASCGPCAAQNPTYHAFITEQLPARVLPLSFRSRYPGRDVMNAANATMHDGRVAYYGSPGVPHVRMNGKFAPPSPGWYDGGAADTMAQSKYLAAIPAMSPISVSVVETRNGPTVDVVVSVTSVEAVSNAKLQVVVAEAHHYYASAGTNGEKDFYNVARQMLPGVDGTALTLAAGESRSFNFQYTMDATNWNSDQIYVAAFVQDNSSKEILQAAASSFRPMLSMDVTTAPVVVKNESTPSEWIGAVRTSVPGEYTVSIKQSLPSGWAATVTINGRTVANGEKITIADANDVPINATISPSARAGSGQVAVALTNGHQEAHKTFRLFSGRADIALLVRDEGRADIAEKYDQALAQNTRSYVILDAGVEKMFDLREFDVVMFETGKNVVGEADVQKLKAYLDGGGRLLLAGAEIAWGLVDTTAQQQNYYHDPAFVTDYLKARYLADGTSSLTTVKGVAGDPVTDGLNVRINNGVPNQDTPDEFAALSDAVQICTYNDNKGAGLRFADSKYRLVYFGFGMEGIGDAAQRASLIDKSITWLLGSDLTVAGVAGQSELAGASIGAQPNPAGGIVEIPVTLPRAMFANVAVFDARGERVATIASRQLESGLTTLRWDASSVAAGMYVVVLSSAEGRMTQMVTVVR